ncbi:MAG: asparagine synthase-related protein [Acidobacteriota bacterium]
MLSHTGTLSDRAEQDLTRLSEGLRRLGPDGEERVLRAGVGMAYRPFHTRCITRPPSGIAEGPPDALIAWDGRLDNRRELAPLLGEGSDAEVALRAYGKWGVDGFSRLIGDYALALWDGHRRRLMLARDPLGARPLYFMQRSDRLAWASSLESLLAVSADPPEINDQYLADYLFWSKLRAHTPYVGLYRVMPGTAVICSQGELSHRQFWQPSIDPDASTASMDACAERFRELFEQSVEARLDVDSAVFAELSGGLDSSSIVCMADSILARRNGDANELFTASYVFDRTTRTDERPFMAEVERRRGQAGVHISDIDAPMLSPLPEGFYCEQPSSSILYQARYSRLAAEMAQRGSRVLLVGRGGDQVAWGVTSPFDLADLLKQRRWSELFRQTKRWGSTRRESYVQLLWGSAIQPLLPYSWRGARARTEVQIPEWFQSAFTLEVARKHRGRDQPDIAESFECRDTFLPSHRRHLAEVQLAVAGIETGVHVDGPPIEIRHPFLDRRLVEFCLSMPTAAKFSPGLPRPAARRAMAGLLPETIARRTTKTATDGDLSRSVNQAWPWLQPLFRPSRLAERGILNDEAFLGALQGWRHGLRVNGVLLQRVLSLELWLRSIEARRGSEGRKEETPGLAGATESTWPHPGTEARKPLRDGAAS